ncbi:MAG: tetratricopeptide repeat protein, partial [Planctomycetes bacterium]|nr:tetratricopeptide repeat protein [Planctomycetota bacterium]
IEAQQTYLRLQPDGVSAIGVRAQLANSLAKTGNLDEAVKVRDELASIDPRSQFLMPTTKFLADTAFAHERYELSRMLYTKMVEAAQPKLAAEGLSGLAWTLAKLGESVESATTFTRLVDRFPKSSLAAESAVMAARQLQKTGKGIAAAKMYERVASDYADSDYLGEAALAVASFYTTEGADKRKAVELLHRVCTANTQHSQIDAVLYRLAWVLVDLERLDEADKVFQRINRDYRNSRFWADATYRLAERAANADNDDLATKLAGDLIASNIQGDVRCHALYLKGQLAAESERWEDVEQTMQRIVEGFPESSLMLPSEYWLAEAKHRLGKIDEAAPLFKRLEKKTHNIREPWHAIICLRQAQILATKKQWLDAYEVANSIAERFPGFRQQHEVDYVLGRCLSNRAEFQAARQAYERVVRSPAGNRTETAAMAQWMIGESLLHQKKYDEAIRAYHRVETLYDFPRWQAAALLQAGKCHEAKGEVQNAIRLYASLLKKYSDTSFVDEASQRLRAARKDTPADS